MDAVRTCLHTRMADCSIEAVSESDAVGPLHNADSANGDSSSRKSKITPSPAQGKACKDASAAIPLRRLLSIQRTHSEPGKSAFLMTSQPDDPLGRPHDLEVLLRGLRLK